MGFKNEANFGVWGFVCFGYGLRFGLWSGDGVGNGDGVGKWGDRAGCHSGG